MGILYVVIEDGEEETTNNME
ncbi:uncharacterized protein G2W53_035523 [Senna tora]|uniref:Uncharacterized protein n=1 Tax=Senna tora TaxID=362788 RepID=A0A834SQM3_9FABA|nr:uncharacterized protein G2W53_035523 [Senna tora]